MPDPSRSSRSLDLAHELEHRHKLRRLVLARPPHRDDARELADINFERAALACGRLAATPVGLEREASTPGVVPLPDLESEALQALAESAASAAAAVLGSATRDATPEADLELRWPDQSIRRLPAGGGPLDPSSWFRAVACALLVRDTEAIEILVYPDHIDLVQLPPHLGDPFWLLLCRATATVVCGVGLPDGTLPALSAALEPERITCADPGVIQSQIAPLVPLLGALNGQGDFSAALRRAVEEHRAGHERSGAPHDPYRCVALEALGLAALAHDRGLAFDPGDLPDRLIQGAPNPPRITVTLAYRLRLAARGEDPTGFLDLRGFPRSGRDHAVLSRAGKLVAHYTLTGRLGAPRATAEFLLPEPGSKEDLPPPALDPGERVRLAELYARESGAAADQGDPRVAATWRVLAAEMIDVVLASIPSSANSVPETAFVNPRGREVYHAEPGRFRRERLLAFRNAIAVPPAVGQQGVDARPGEPSSSQPSLSRRTGESQGQGQGPSDAAGPRPSSRADSTEAKQATGNSIELIRSAVRPVLLRLADDPEGEQAAQLKPRSEDYTKVFAPDALAVALDGFEALWRSGVKVERIPSAEPGLQIFVAPAGMLSALNELSHHFPQGYRAIARWLNPHRTWICWRYLRPGETSGVAYDGLVWCDDHWAWFPKPYRVLGKLVTG